MIAADISRIRVIDSHTEGEPTRVVISGGPDLGSGSLVERLNIFRDQYDDFRRLVILEPRGYDAMVGALLCQPTDPTCAAGVIYFNNAGYLGMCGHGSIGVAVTLYYLGKIDIGRHRLETPVGIIEFDLKSPNRVTIENVASYRHQKGISFDVPGVGLVTGDIAYGGNWFFLVNQPSLELDVKNVRALGDAAEKVKRRLVELKITGANGAEIDHIEFFGPAVAPDGNSRNFVYCPGGEYDRSPCGTGTSAKVACLAADSKLKPGDIWIQESIIGSRFEASYRLNQKMQVIPRVTGHAYVCAESNLIKQPGDPLPASSVVRNEVAEPLLT